MDQAHYLFFPTDPSCVRQLHPGETVTLGRAREATVPVYDKSVSRKHARIQWEDDRAVLVDEKSRNATWVDGLRIERAVLGDGSWFRLGRVSLVYGVVPRRRLVRPVPAPDGGEERAVQAAAAWTDVVSRGEGLLAWLDAAVGAVAPGARWEVVMQDRDRMLVSFRGLLGGTRSRWSEAGIRHVLAWRSAAVFDAELGGTVSTMAAPLTRGGSRAAVLHVTAPEGVTFAEPDLVGLVDLAAKVGALVENAPPAARVWASVREFPGDLVDAVRPATRMGIEVLDPAVGLPAAAPDSAPTVGAVLARIADTLRAHGGALDGDFAHMLRFVWDEPDHPNRALAAALVLRGRFGTRIRIGVHTSFPGNRHIGNLRSVETLCQTAAPGEIVCSAPTWDRVFARRPPPSAG